MQATISPVTARLQTAYNNAVNQGQVLDVSGIREDGTGTRRVDYPRTATGTRKWVGSLPIISNSYEAYAFAVRNLGVPDAEGYSSVFLQSYGAQPLERQANLNRPAPLTPFPGARGALIVPVSQVTVSAARSPAKRGGRRAAAAAPKAPRSPAKRTRSPAKRARSPAKRATKPKAHHVQHHRAQSPRIAQVPLPVQQRTVVALPQQTRVAPRIPSPNRLGMPLVVTQRRY